MAWPRDDAKLGRVRALMAEDELDALVVRAPDNVLYLTSFWGMKGYDACVLPREGEPLLITIEASEEDAARMAWTDDVRLIRGYDPEDPRPPLARTLDATVEVASEYERVGLELSLGTQASDRMVGEPTTFTAAWFDAFPEAADAAPLLARARSLETALMDAYEDALDRIRPGAPMAELDRRVREKLHAAGYAGQPTHPICHGVGARAHEPPYPHQAAGGEFAERMVLAVEPGVYWPGGGGLRVEDNFLVTSDGVEKLSSFPDGVVRCPT